MASAAKRIRWVRWIGVAFCCATALVYLVSLWCVIFWLAPGGSLVIAAAGGAVGISWVRPGIGFISAGFTYWQMDQTLFNKTWEDGIWPHFAWNNSNPMVFVPLWLVLAIAVPLTIWAWVRSRRPPPGCCRKCGYDLTGNVSGRCPECGVTVGDAARSVQPSGDQK